MQITVNDKCVCSIKSNELDSLSTIMLSQGGDTNGGILPFTRDSNCLMFSSNGFSNLTSFLFRREATVGDLKRVLNGIIDATVYIKDYLLDPDCILCNSDYMYISDAGKVFVLYLPVPADNLPQRNSVSKFLEDICQLFSNEFPVRFAEYCKSNPGIQLSQLKKQINKRNHFSQHNIEKPILNQQTAKVVAPRIIVTPIKEGGIIPKRKHSVAIESNNSDSIVLYTLDGTNPQAEIRYVSTFKIEKYPAIIRACAMASGCLSDILTCRIPSADSVPEMSREEVSVPQTPSKPLHIGDSSQYDKELLIRVSTINHGVGTPVEKKQTSQYKLSGTKHSIQGTIIDDDDNRTIIEDETLVLHRLVPELDIIISSFPFVIGRKTDDYSPDYDVGIPTVSHAHVTVNRCESGYCIIDRGSTNGTFFKRSSDGMSEKMQCGREYQIKHNDEIGLGKSISSRFKFFIQQFENCNTEE